VAANAASIVVDRAPAIIAAAAIGDARTHIALANKNGHILAEKTNRGRTLHSDRALLDAVADAIIRLADQAQVRLDLRAVGIARHVDPLASDRPLQRALLPRLGLPATLTDSASAAAVAEVRLGAAQGLDDILYVQVLPRIFAGIVLGGRPYHGATGIAGQLAHVQHHRAESAPCSCGSSGCIQTLIPAPLFPTDAAPGRTGHAAANEPWIAAAARGIGAAIVDTCRVLDPTAVIVHAEPHLAAAGLLEAVAREARRQAMRTVLRPPRFMKAALAVRGPLIGALALAADAAEAPPAWGAAQ
jgi:predicted NBD/HSP70 family sugar kinase